MGLEARGPRLEAALHFEYEHRLLQGQQGDTLFDRFFGDKADNAAAQQAVHAVISTHHGILPSIT